MAADFYEKTFSNEPMKVWIAILVKCTFRYSMCGTQVTLKDLGIRNNWTQYSK